MGTISNNFTHTSLFTWTCDDVVVDVFPISGSPFPTTVPWLFAQKEYLEMQTSDVIYSFILTYKESGCILAVFHCISDGKNWFSPPLAPFGGIMPAHHCRKSQLVFMLACIREWIRHHGGNTLTIKTAPSCYDFASHEICHESYLASGFLPNHTYSNHYIPIGSQDFGQIIEPSELRRLSKGKKSSLQITARSGIPDHITEDLLQRCYRARGYQLSIQPEGLARFAGVSPPDYLTISSFDGALPVAAAIIVRVSRDILYHFLSGYLPEYGPLSPCLMIFGEAYKFCQKEEISTFDLGISVDHFGNHKPSLSRFKANIGGLECPKIIYEVKF